MSYYLVQYSDFTANAAHITHYATWLFGGAVTWSTTAPTSAPDNTTTFAVGITKNASAPGEISILGEDGKTLPPPPNAFASSVRDLKDFKEAFGDFVNNRG
jgi:hypothetical protein